MYPNCLATITIFLGITHHSQLIPRIFPPICADNVRTLVVVVVHTLLPRLTPIKWRNTWWRHQMETFSLLLAICAGNPPHKGQWRGALMFSLIYACMNSWVNNREAGDLRRHRAHNHVTVMGMIRFDNASETLSARLWTPVQEHWHFVPKACLCEYCLYHWNIACILLIYYHCFAVFKIKNSWFVIPNLMRSTCLATRMQLRDSKRKSKSVSWRNKGSLQPHGIISFFAFWNDISNHIHVLICNNKYI